MDNISVDKAMMYLTEIKHAFKDDKDKYKEFLRAMTDINERRFDNLFNYLCWQILFYILNFFNFIFILIFLFVELIWHV
jgi:hypothetical protein